MSVPGLVLEVAPALWSTAGSSFKRAYTDEVATWMLKKAAFGGFISAEMPLQLHQSDVEEWLQYGLGCDVKVRNSAQLECWGGFINEISATIGGVTVTRGPLMALGNNVSMVYSTIDTSVTPPVLGVRRTTAIYTDATSIAMHGNIYKILSTGGCIDTDAAQIVRAYLREYAKVQTTKSLSLGAAGGSNNVTLKCLGYINYLNFPYNTTTTGTTTVSAHLAAILAAQPTVVVQTGLITTNALVIPAYDNDSRTAINVIKENVARGGTFGSDAYWRWLFGIYEDRRAYYAPVPNTVEYFHSIAQGNAVISAGGRDIDPWDITPGKWLQLTDYLVGRLPYTADLREDERNIFVESVTYSSPFGLSIEGGKVSSLAQMLAQRGISGIGA